MAGNNGLKRFYGILTSALLLLNGVTGMVQAHSRPMNDSQSGITTVRTPLKGLTKPHQASPRLTGNEPSKLEAPLRSSSPATSQEVNSLPKFLSLLHRRWIPSATAAASTKSIPSANNGTLLSAKATITNGSWTALTPATSPSGRDGAAIAYDPKSGQVLLFGGADDNYNPLGDTWSWNGKTWTQLSPGTSPPARWGARMVYDPANGTVVLFGGIGDQSFLNDTWTWDGSNWSQESPMHSPSPRCLEAMAYDPSGNKVLLFGGQYDNDTGTLSSYGDTWTWDGTDWTQLQPASSPPGRAFTAMEYDPQSQKVILHAGDSSSVTSDDTWEWDGSDWTSLPQYGGPANGGAMVNDAALNVDLYFDPLYGTTWLWNQGGWDQIYPWGSPTGLFEPSLVYDASTNNVLLFGGLGNSSNSNATWVWSNGSPTPTTESVVATPTQVPADGSSTATVTAKVTDQNGNPLSGVSVSFSTNLGALGTSTMVTTDASGQATDTITSTAVGTATVTASVAGISTGNTASVTFTTPSLPVPEIVTASPSIIPADGSTNSTITATVRDQNENPLPGVLVTFSTTLGTLGLPTTATTDSNGQATDTISSTAVGTATVTAGVAGISSGNKVSVTFAPLSGLLAVAGGYETGYILKSDGTVWAWGDNTSGQLGNNSSVSYTSDAVRVSGLTGVTALAAGYLAGYALKSDGTVWGWGYNASGQLGNDSTIESPVPVQAHGLTGIKAIASSGVDGYALKSDGTVWAWGDGESGELGSSAPDSSVPVQVYGLTGVTAIAAGADFACALKSDGTVWTWGGADGPVGTSTWWVPVQVPGLTGVTAMAGGEFTAYALKSDGTVWAWGGNPFGELGNDSTINSSSTPVEVSGLTSATAIAAGENAGYALKSDGTVWAWGWNALGQLGDGSYTDSYHPVQVTGLMGVTAIAGGFDNGYALKSDGTAWDWGSDENDNLGTIQIGDGRTPVQVTPTWNGEATPVAATESVTTSPTSVPADGNTPSTVTATVKDQNGNPMPGVSVTFSTNLGTLGTPATVTTASSGQATDTVTSTAVGTATVTASAAGISTGNTASVTFAAVTVNPYALTVHTDRTSYTPGQTIDITGTITEGGSPVPGVTVTGTVYDPNANNQEALQTTSDANGAFTATATVGSTWSLGTYTVNVSGAGATAESTFQVLAGYPASVNLSLGQTKLGPGATTTITGQVSDAHGNPVATATVELSTTGAAQLSPPSVTTATDGSFNGRLTAPTAVGTGTVTATVGGVSSNHVAYTVVAGQVAKVTLTLGQTTLGPDQNTTLGGKVSDAYGNPVANTTVELTATNGAMLSSPSVVTAADGSFSASLTAPTTVVSGRVYATISGVSGVSNSSSYTVLAAQPAIVNVNAPAQGTAGKTLTVSGSVTDKYGNAVTDGTTVVVEFGSALPLIARTANGGFTVTVPVPQEAGAVDLTVTADGRATSQTVTVISAVVVQLAGQVVDPQGNPVPGAAVDAMVSGQVYGTATDVAGNFGLSDLAAGSYSLVVTPPAERPDLTATTLNNVTVNGTTKQLGQIQLATVVGPTVSGTVYLNKAEEQNVTVVASAYSGSLSTTTDRNGQYTLNLAPGIWQITPVPSGSGWVYNGEPTTIETSESVLLNRVDFQLSPTSYTVTGYVNNPSGYPVPPDEVQVTARTSQGVGTTAEVGTGGEYSLGLPAGSYNLSVVSDNPDWLSPSPTTVTVTGDVSAPTMTLKEANSTLTGYVYESGTKVGLAGLPIAAWLIGGFGVSQTTTAANGSFSFTLAPGPWSIGLVGGEGALYQAVNAPLNLELAPGNNYAKPIYAVYNNGTLQGSVTDSSGNPITQGWVQVTGVGGFATGTGVTAGEYHLSVPEADVPFTLTLKLPPGSDLTAPANPATVSSFTNDAANANLVAGNLTYPVSGTVVNQLGATDQSDQVEVTAVDQNGDQTSVVSQKGQGLFTLNLAPGSWTLAANPVNGAAALVTGVSPEPLSVVNGTNTVTVKVASTDAILNGTVTGPNGRSVAGAWVTVSGQVGTTVYRNQEMTGSDGTFRLAVPSTYSYQVVVTDTALVGDIAPPPVTVIAQPDPSPSNTINGLQFTLGRYDLSATVSVETPDGFPIAYDPSQVKLWAMSSGSDVATVTYAAGLYDFGQVTSGTWQVGAAYSAARYGGHGTASVNITDQGDKVAVTIKTEPLPGQITQEFQADTTGDLNLGYLDSDDYQVGVDLTVPPDSIATSGSFVVKATPDALLPDQPTAYPLGFGYQLQAFALTGQPITGAFNAPVTITLHYDPLLLKSAGLTPNDLVPSYWDPSSGTFVAVSGAVVDVSSCTVTFQVQHFTTFTLISQTAASAGSAPIGGGGGGGAPPSPGTPIGPKGGSVNSLDGRLTVNITAGALNASGNLVIQAPATSPPNSEGSLGITGEAYQISLSGITAPNLSMTLQLDLPGTVQSSQLDLVGIYTYTDSGWQYVSGLVDPSAKTVTGKVYGPGTYAVGIYTVTFPDVSSDYWAANDIATLVGHHLVNGMPDGTFAPEQSVTRAQFAKLIVLAMGLKPNPDAAPTFKDVSTGDWDYGYVAAAQASGLIEGYNGSFNPNAVITREQMAAIMVRALETEGLVTPVAGADSLSTYQDSSSVDAWAQSYMATAVNAGLIHGLGSEELAPLNDTTRAQSATITVRILKLLGLA